MKFNNTHHEAFAKFFEAPTRPSLRDLLKNDIGETDYLDFKREWPDYPKVARHVLALGNSGGGALILGVEEDKNGVLRPVGVGSLRGKEDVYKGIKSYLPSEIRMDVLDFSYSESEYRSIQGLSFQVMVVEYDAELVPLLASRSGTGIKENVVYVRKGTSSEEANGTELRALIDKRIKAGTVSSATPLEEHLRQLETLSKARRNRGGILSDVMFSGLLDGNSTRDYFNFIDEIFEVKKRQIKDLLKLDS